MLEMVRVSKDMHIRCCEFVNVNFKQARREYITLLENFSCLLEYLLTYFAAL